VRHSNARSDHCLERHTVLTTHRSPIIEFLVLAALGTTLPLGCRQSPQTRPNGPGVEIVTHSVAPIEHGAAPEQRDDGSLDDWTSSTLGDARSTSPTTASQIEDWAERLLVIESRGSVVIRGDGVLVDVEIPCRLRIDEFAAVEWIHELTSTVEDLSGRSQIRRILTRAANATAPSEQPMPSNVGAPIMAMSTLDLPATDEPSHVGLILADGPGWGVTAKVFRLGRTNDVDEVLSAIGMPETVEMLARRRGEVVHGASIPMLPFDFDGGDQPQPHASPWWIRDRRDDSDGALVWRNAATWLSPHRSLSEAMRERPDTVGDILFMPLLGWQRSMSSPQYAVGSLDLTIRVRLPRELAESIDQFEFRISER